ncbi:MAG TPA: DsrE family protein [Thermoanaerobaculia bacterium]|nr:DsrE family protein [Thermoanaerobaculia bacterium]
MKTLFILNDPPYGTERTYNGLRLAYALGKRDEERVRLFLIGDGAACAKRGQKTPAGYYNLESMLKGIVNHGGEIAVCGSCIDARGIAESELAPGASRGSMDQLATWTAEADRVLVF